MGERQRYLREIYHEEILSNWLNDACESKVREGNGQGG